MRINIKLSTFSFISASVFKWISLLQRLVVIFPSQYLRPVRSLAALVLTSGSLRVQLDNLKVLDLIPP